MPRRDIVRAERALSRAGLWATTHVQLQLPLDARGLSELVRANGRLRITPDYDVFAYLCEGCLAQANPDGWVRFTLYDLGWAIYHRAPQTRDRRELRQSLTRLRSVQVELIGFDSRHQRLDQRIASHDNLVDRVRSELDELGTDVRKIGALRGSTFEVQLPPWLRLQLEQGSIVRVHWPTLLKFGRNQQLAKRLFVYLGAERWRRISAAHEDTRIPVCDWLFNALGMNYAEPRLARSYLAKAARTVASLDARLVSIEIKTVRPGRPGRAGSYELYATRLSKDGLKARKDLSLLPLDPQTDRARRRVARAVSTAQRAELASVGR
jgi:hypothetical protein